MFSDSVFESIHELFVAIEHYNADPFNYSLNYEKQLIVALENLYYIIFRLDYPNIPDLPIPIPFTSDEKIMDMAKKEVEFRMNRIKQGLPAFED